MRCPACAMCEIRENVKRARWSRSHPRAWVRDAQPEIAKHTSQPDEFRKFAPGNGVDADLVINALGLCS